MKKVKMLSVLVFMFSAVMPVASAGALTEYASLIPQQFLIAQPIDVPPLDRCLITQTRIEKAIENIQTRADKKKARYQDIQQKVRRIIALAEQHGVDPSVLVEDLAILDSKVGSFTSEVRELVGILKETHDLVCGDDKEAFNEALKKSRIQLKVVRELATGIQTFLSNTLIPDARKVLSEIKQ